MEKRKKIAMTLSTLGVFLILFGVSYSFFNYTRTGSSNVIKVGRISFNSNQIDTISLLNVFPIDKTNARTDNTNTDDVVITITGDTTYNEGIEYLFTITSLTNTLNNKEIPIDILVSPANIGDPDNDYFDNRGSTTTIYKVLNEGTISNNQKLLVGYIPKGNNGINGSVTIRAYLDKDKIGISDTYNNGETPTDNLGTPTSFGEGRTILTTTEWNSLQANGVSFQVKVEANEGTWVEAPGYLKVRKAITEKINATTNSCNPIWVDDNGTASDTSDDITYFSGTNDCVDMNYVWYSGKLWRITAIYPDGSMKLVTEESITSIYWGSDVEYDGSWIYQWLNEDFYDTLYNTNNIVKSNNTWNYSTDASSTPVKSETIESQKTKLVPVGLLNAYEYYNAAYRNASESNNYLNIGYTWWLITAYNTSLVRNVKSNGLQEFISPSANARGVRPSIVIKSGLEFNGSGTKTLPYKIAGDKEEVVSNTTLLSSRSVGEYVRFDSKLYRIVDTTGGITKLTSLDYIKDEESDSNPKPALKKRFASTNYFRKSTNADDNIQWDYYLNNTWYNSITTTYKTMLVDGTYYLGMYPNATNYKATICKDAILDNVTTKNCTKYTSTDTDKTFTGKVGLPRSGEMFAAQIQTDVALAEGFWLITPTNIFLHRFISRTGYGTNYGIESELSVRPSITLKSGIKITGGTGYVGGETNSPFEISE